MIIITHPDNTTDTLKDGTWLKDRLIELGFPPDEAAEAVVETTLQPTGSTFPIGRGYTITKPHSPARPYGPVPLANRVPTLRERSKPPEGEATK